MKTRTLLITTLAMLATAATSLIAADAPTTAPDQAMTVIKAIEPSTVQVEYTVQHDKGEEPGACGWRTRCPNCGGYHSVSASEAVKEERPLSDGGFLVAPDMVLTSDLTLNPRFIKSIKVRRGDKVVDATLDRLVLNQNGRLLRLAEPLDNATPLRFDASRSGPYYAVTYARQNARWGIAARGVSQTVQVQGDGQVIWSAPTDCILTDEQGVPVAATMSGRLTLDDSWKGSPLDWPALTADQLAQRTAAVRAHCQQALMRVRLSFRSPRKDGGDRNRDDDENSTQKDVTGVLLADGRVLVLEQLKPQQTARLEGITLNLADGKSVAAAFEYTLRDYGVFTVKPQEPLTGGVEFSTRAITSYQDQILIQADVRIQGEKRVDYYQATRIPSFEIGWREQVYPEVQGDDDTSFLFDAQGKLVALPLALREKPGEARYSYSSNEPVAIATLYIQPVLADVVASADTSNVPLSEEEESRLAWLGVELQPLDRELARLNKVSDLTGDGESGALVSFVYSDSPAEKAGIVAGDILLRLHVEQYPAPVDIKLESNSDRAFPWERLDEVPEQYFERIPRPWPSVRNTVNTTLTEIGFGKSLKLEYVHDGQTKMCDLTVQQSPAHYDTAQRCKSKPLGLTVHALTYETQRYFQMKSEDPGVLVAKIEPGSKSAVAGIKPYEIVTHVNGQPVTSVADFESLVSDGGDSLRLSVKRMQKGRVVKIRMDKATSGPASGPSSEPATQAADTQPAQTQPATTQPSRRIRSSGPRG